jgi:hypothetical protein
MRDWATSLMRIAVERLAPELRAQMREEWSALLDDMPPGLWRVLMAADLLRAAYGLNLSVGYTQRRKRGALDIVVDELKGAEWVMSGKAGTGKVDLLVRIAKEQSEYRSIVLMLPDDNPLSGIKRWRLRRWLRRELRRSEKA